MSEEEITSKQADQVLLLNAQKRAKDGKQLSPAELQRIEAHTAGAVVAADPVAEVAAMPTWKSHAEMQRAVLLTASQVRTLRTKGLTLPDSEIPQLAALLWLVQNRELLTTRRTAKSSKLENLRSRELSMRIQREEDAHIKQGTAVAAAILDGVRVSLRKLLSSVFLARMRASDDTALAAEIVNVVDQAIHQNTQNGE